MLGTNGTDGQKRERHACQHADGSQHKPSHEHNPVAAGTLQESHFRPPADTPRQPSENPVEVQVLSSA